MNLFRRPRYGWLHSGLMALAIAILAIVLLVAWLPKVAAAALGEPDDDAWSVCWEDRTVVEFEHERTVVVQPEVTVTEQLFVKQVHIDGTWVDWDSGSVTRWEPENFTEEGWIAGLHYRYRPIEGETRTTVTQEETTERLVEWFDSTAPSEDWAPTGQSRVTAIEVEVPCLAQPPACEGPECRAPTLPADPCSVWPEECVDHTDDQPDEDEVEVGLIADERPPTLPRTGVETWHLIALAAGLASLGASLLIVTRGRQETPA